MTVASLQQEEYNITHCIVYLSILFWFFDGVIDIDISISSLPPAVPTSTYSESVFSCWVKVVNHHTRVSGVDSVDCTLHSPNLN